MADQLRILVVGAHPADIFDQSGGTMAHHTARGDYVACCVLTHGARVHDKVISVELAQRAQVPDSEELLRLMAERSDVKANETRAACKIVGVEDIYFFGADDAVLLQTPETVRAVARLIRQVCPDIVITHFPKESDSFTNPHAITGQIVNNATHLAANVDPGDRNRPHKVAQLFYFGIGAGGVRSSFWHAEGGYYNDVFVDITDVIDKKLAALDCMASQGYDGAYARKRIEASDAAFGVAVRCAYAEAFISARASAYYYLPLPDHLRMLAKMTDKDILERVSYRLRTD